MFKVIALVKRKSGMPVEDFQRYWRCTHGPLLARIAAVRRHALSCALPQGYQKGELVFDGIGEIWFDSAEAYEAYRHDPATVAILADQANFTEPSRTVLMPVDVHVIKHGTPTVDAVKNIELINRKTGMASTAFSQYWRSVHGPIAARIPAIQRYEQNHLRTDVYAAQAAPPYDGIAIAWFANTANMKQGAATPEYAATRADEANFLADHGTSIIIARESTAHAPGPAA